MITFVKIPIDSARRMWFASRVNEKGQNVSYPKCPWVCAWLIGFGVATLALCAVFILSRI